MAQPAARHPTPTSIPGVNPVWHSLPGDEAVHALGTSHEGLTQAETQARLRKYGPNRLKEAKPESKFALVLRQINNPLIYVLLASTVIAFLMGKTIDASVVLGVVVLNTLIGYIQEAKAGEAIQALMQMAPEITEVIRDGIRQRLPATELVPGDLVFLQAGDKVPADLRILESRNLRVEEAALTGESVPVEKASAPVPADAELSDRTDLLFSGTLLASGTAKAVVTETGQRTELGKISSMLETTTQEETPLTVALARLGKTLTWVICAVALALLGIGLLRGAILAEAALAAISFAVAAIPEGLPTIITIGLAIGVRRMAQRRALIRKLPAVETLGSTTVICSDKTGTLTRNEMMVKESWTPQGSLRFEGSGYIPEGRVLNLEGSPVTELPPAHRELLVAGALCNDANLIHKDGQWEPNGDPTEVALLVSARKAGMVLEEIKCGLPRIDAIPFESENQFMATLHRASDSAAIVYLKGSPEAVLKCCSGFFDGSPWNPQSVVAQVERLAALGTRVLAFARKEHPDDDPCLAENHVGGDFRFLGLQGMIDPPRTEVIEAIRRCREAGIEVKMITGDHKATARAIARDLGILTEDKVLGGQELHSIAEEDLPEIARRTHVYARVAPEHKLKLVRALQSKGQIVAMTGDGVNDAPALRQANIGVAMGITGTAVSKEAADIILTDDNFASITAAVEEGRRVYDNLIKSLVFVLPTNLGMSFIMLIAGSFFPIVDGHPVMAMSPVQILWINLVTTVGFSLPLAFEAHEPGIMRRPPRPPHSPLLSPFVVQRMLLVAVVMACVGLGLFLYEYFLLREQGESPVIALREAQTITVTATTFLQGFYLFNCRSFTESVFRIGLWSNPAIYIGLSIVVILQLGFVYLPFMHRLFGSAPLGFDEWVKVLLCAASIVPVVALEKSLRNRKERITRRGGARASV